MDDDELDTKHCLLVKIDPPMSAEDVGEEGFNCLEMYMENTTGNNSKCFKFNGTRSYAIIKFEKPISDVDALQKKSDEKPLKDYRITVKTIPLVDRVLVTGLPVDKFYNRDDPLECELLLYFESKTFCPDGGDVKKLDVLPCQHAFVVQFEDHTVVKKLKTDHKLGESRFTVRPLNIFESVEGPCCSVCNEEVEGADDMAEDTGEASWHSACEDAGSQKNEERSGSRSNSDTDQDIDTLKDWSAKNKDTTSTQSRNEYSSSTSGKSASVRKFTESDNSERTQLLLKTIKYKRIPGLLPEEHDMIKLSKSSYEIMGDDKKKADRIRKVIEDVQGSGDVDLADHTVVADKLNCSNGRRWITELLDDLKIPANIKHDKSTLYLSAINLELAEEAAKTVAISLLPARIKCDERQMSKCSKILHDKDKILMSKLHRSSGYLELLGLPIHVLKAVSEIEQKLHGSSWPIR